MGVTTPKPNVPPRERFLRGRQKHNRQRRRRWKTVLKVGSVLMGLALLTSVLLWTVTAAGQAPELTVHRVVVDGNAQLSQGEILELLEISEGVNILMLDLEDVRERLLRSAWVEDVEVERVLPGTLHLAIRERQPVAVAVLDELYLLASDGTILDQLSPRYDIEKLVLVRGLLADETFELDRGALAGRLADALMSDERLVPLVSEIDVSGGESSVALRLRTPPMTVLVAEPSAMRRLTEIVPLLDGIHAHYADVEVVDLRFEGRIFLRLRDQAVAVGGEYTSAAFASGGASF